jgi:hypothetical protein
MISSQSLNKNKVLIYTKGHKKVMKHELITDDLKDIIKAIIRGDFNVEEDVELLEDNEQKLLNEILSVCKIQNVFQIRYYHRDTAKNRLISKFNIMKGEILLGNDNPEMLQDFKELLTELEGARMLTKTELTKLRSLLK